MKKFFTAIPLQISGQLGRYHYRAVGNARLQLEEAVSFPILTAIGGYVAPGEPFRVIGLAPDTDDGRRNLAALKEQLGELCRRRGLVPEEPELIPLAGDERVASHVAAFQALIERVEAEDELFACITYGTKPLSQAMLLAVQYAYRVKANTSLSCVVYGQIDRSKSRDPGDWTACVYDETALIQLDEIVRLLADRGIADPKEALDSILSL